MNAVLRQIDFSSSQKIAAEAAQSIIEDPSIYEYDNVYDDIKQKREEIAESKKKARQ